MERGKQGYTIYNSEALWQALILLGVQHLILFHFLSCVSIPFYLYLYFLVGMITPGNTQLLFLALYSDITPDGAHYAAIEPR